MEHRWGRRIAIKIPVRLIVESGDPVIGETQNISISGAFVQTARPVPLWARLEVEVILPGQRERRPERVAAHVMRRARDGVAIEWCDLAPQAVRALVLAAEPVAARPARPEACRSLRPDPELRTEAFAESAAGDDITATPKLQHRAE